MAMDVDSLVGMNSVIMDGAVIGEESIVAAMSFVKAGFQGQPRQMLMSKNGNGCCQNLNVANISN